ncbi:MULTISPECIES: DMT family transporter [Cytobacillus]|uniref:DMT family transporter n=1 Tax=Cytobacillus stercorigallinarum TaxID=2762240 RepID=A0ABR8QLW3_9BACI|nr:DMT family transporter [Cytobacillus stercorigallinarum]MBD7936419.1 DMT family transporter [Cytobacillus stercorigallinarum]
MGIIMILFTIIGGITLSAQSAINGSFSRRAGTIETTFLTFITGSMLLALIILFFGQGNIFAIFDAPLWQLSAVFLGVIFLLFNVFAVTKIGVIATSITVIIGQLVISVVIDHFGWFNSLIIPLDTKRWFALLFMLIALYFIFKGNKRSVVESKQQK